MPETQTADLAPAVRRRLIETFGAEAEFLPHQRRLYGYDATGLSGMPGAVVHVRSANDVRALVEIAHDFDLTLTARGAGTGLSGGAVPQNGGIVLSFERMRGVGAIDTTLLRVWVEPGVVNQSLESTLAPLGLFYPPDPASYRVSTIGGNIAENAGGPRAVKYGVTGHHVRRLAVVDAGARVGELTAGENQPGADLVSLVVGSEGTLAIVTGAELTLRRLPERVATVLVSFAAMLQATRFVSAIVERGTIPLAIEFLDRATIDAIETWGVASYPEGSEAVILLDVEGTKETVRADTAVIRDLALALDAIDIAVAEEEEPRNALWLGRRGSFAATARHGKRILIQDVTVPREHLTEMLAEIDRIGRKHGILVSTKGHAGDGNLHPDLPYNPDDPDMDRRVHEANLEVLKACVALGGSITGEHGIGTDKLHQLPLMYDETELGLMWAVKAALDPRDTLNPAKAVLRVPRQGQHGAGRRIERPKSAAGVRSSVLRARSSSQPLRLSLEELREVRVDLANMTVTAGAGATAADIEAALAATPLRLPVTPIRGGSLARAVLTNDYGPEHVQHGTFRRCLLAATYVAGAGEVVRMGRPIMKNVAGYDLYRLLIGSRGTLGVPVSFVFRLAPRDDSCWQGRELEAGEVLDQVLREEPEALFALPTGEEKLRVFGRFTSRTKGWRETPEAERLLGDAIEAMAEAGDILDIAFPANIFGRAMSLLETVPILTLPAAGRILVRTQRDRAEQLTDQIAALSDGAVRASWGTDLTPLHHADPLAERWESALRDVFDPDGILSVWLT